MILTPEGELLLIEAFRIWLVTILVLLFVGSYLEEKWIAFKNKIDPTWINKELQELDVQYVKIGKSFVEQLDDYQKEMLKNG